MRYASIRALQHGLATFLRAVESGEEVLITRRGRPVAKIGSLKPDDLPATASHAKLKRYWDTRPAPPKVRSKMSHADLVGEGRGTS